MGLTLAQIRTQALALADMPANSFQADARVDEMINAGVAEAHGILATLFEDHTSKTVEFTTSASTDEYAIGSGAAINAADVWKLRGIDLKGSTLSDRVALERFEWSERDAWNEYPPSGKTYIVRYVPTYTALSGSAEWAWTGYEDLAVLEAAIRLRISEETDVQELLLRKAEVLGRIQTESATRDADRPRRAVRIRTGGRSRWVNPARADGGDVAYCLLGTTLVLRRPTVGRLL